MKRIYSIIQPEKLLHVIYSKNDLKLQSNSRIDLVDENQFIQVAALKLGNKTTFKPHEHIYKSGEEKVIAQESWVIIQGKVMFHYYDLNGTHLGNEILNAGDCSITLFGGHTYTILDNDTLVYEYKTGPYYGIEKDKIFY